MKINYKKATYLLTQSVSNRLTNKFFLFINGFFTTFFILGYFFNNDYEQIFYISTILYFFVMIIKIMYVKKIKFDTIDLLLLLFLTNITISILINLVTNSPFMIDYFSVLLNIIAVFLLIFLTKNNLKIKLFKYIYILYYALLIFWYPLDIWRYQGSFNDPNYSVIVFLLGVYISLIDFKYNKFLNLIILILSNFFIILTASRSGYLALCIFYSILYIGKIKSLKKSKLLFKKRYFLIILTLFLLFNFVLNYEFNNLYINIFKRQLEYTMDRFFNPQIGDIRGANSRIREIKSANYFFLNDDNLKFIYGYGYRSSMSNYFIMQSPYSNNRIHNTFYSVLFEQGIVGLSIFCLILFIILKKIIKQKNYKNIALFFGIITSSMFIYNIYFLPFWLSLIIINNNKEKEVMEAAKIQYPERWGSQKTKVWKAAERVVLNKDRTI
jgi:hypothetical protein